MTSDITGCTLQTITLLFRVVEIHRICEATATPLEEGANLSEFTARAEKRRTIRGFEQSKISSPLIE